MIPEDQKNMTTQYRYQRSLLSYSQVNLLTCTRCCFYVCLKKYGCYMIFVIWPFNFLLSILEWKGVYFEVFLSLDHEYLKADIMFVSCYIIRNVLCSSWLIINDRCSHSDGLQERYHVRYGDDSVILVRVYMFLEFSTC